MPSDSSFVKLPSLKSISVENYLLFAKSWSYDVKDGMNLFIGTNGLGKTTTTALIVYGLVGYTAEIGVDYFENRGFNQNSDKKPIIKLKFSVGEHVFDIHRNIIADEILYLQVDDHIYSSDDIDNLDEVYEGLLTQYTGIGSLNDIIFLLQRFLIRQEEGNYLIWDDKGGDQSKLIRILINKSGFELEYEKIARKVKDLDSLVRGKQDVRAQFVKRFNELESEKKHELEKRDGYDQRQELENALSGLTIELDRQTELRDKNLENVDYLTNAIKELDSKIESLSADYEAATEKISTLEGKLFKHVYSDEKVLTSIHKLKHYGVCIYCNKKPNATTIKRIVEKLEIRNECPVCDSALDLVHPDLDNTEIISALEALQSEAHLSDSQIQELVIEKQPLKNDLDKLWAMQEKLEKDINALSIEVYDIKLKISNFNKNPEEQITIYDTQILALKKQIDKFDEEIEPERLKLDYAKEELQKKNEEQNLVISTFEDKLNDLFKKYATIFFKSDCELVTVERRPRESNISVKSYVPSFEGKRRIQITQCSTSQRLFLEYLFRVSLLELYTVESGNIPFIIMETTEGAFDITNTVQLASSFNEFSKSNIPLILITNFSKPDFLQGLAPGVNYSKSRVVNYLNFGRMSPQQEVDLPKYKKVLKSIKLV